MVVSNFWGGAIVFCRTTAVWQCAPTEREQRSKMRSIYCASKTVQAVLRYQKWGGFVIKKCGLLLIGF
jgi:hypothetical protein